MRVTLSTDILNLLGLGLCAPDLLFRNPRTGASVYLEVLGDELPGALNVYKRIRHAATVLNRVEALAERATEPE